MFADHKYFVLCLYFTELWWICNGYGISREQTTSAASKREGVFAYLGKTNACIVEYEGIFGKSVHSLKSIKHVQVWVSFE